MVSIAELEIRVKSLEAELAAKRLTGLGKAGDRAERSIDSFAKTAVVSDRLVTRMGASFLRTSVQVGRLAGGLATIAGAVGGVRVLATYESTLAQVRGIAIKTNETLAVQEMQFRSLSRAAQELGSTTRFSATEAGEAQLFLARAGFEVVEILDALPATLSLAAAGNLELGRAADIASNTLSQFNLAAAETGRVGDILVNTANSSNTSVDQLSEALKFAGPVAAGLGQDLEQVAASIGVLGDSAIQGGNAGRSLRVILTALIAPSGQVASTLDELAARVGETRDIFDITQNSLGEVFSAFQRTGAGAQELNAVFGRLAVSAGISLTNAAEKVDELAEANAGAVGEAQRLADIQNNTLLGALRGVASAAQGAVQSIGEAGLTGALKEALFVVADVIRLLSGFEDLVSKDAVVARQLAEAIGLVSVAAAAFIALSLAEQFLFLSVNVGKASGALKILFGLISASPFGALGLAITAAATALFVFRDRTVEVGGTTASVGELVAATWQIVIERLRIIFQAFQEVYLLLYENLVFVTKATGQGMLDIFEGVLNAIGIGFNGTFGGIVDLSVTVANRVISVFDTLIDAVAAIASRITNILGTLTLFDPLAPFESAGQIKEALALNLDPGNLFSDIGRKARENFEQDYIGEIVNAFGALPEFVQQNFEEAFGSRFSQDLFAALDFSTLGSDISERFAEIKQAADDTLAANEVRDGLNQQLAEINAELDDLEASIPGSIAALGPAAALTADDLSNVTASLDSLLGRLAQGEDDVARQTELFGLTGLAAERESAVLGFTDDVNSAIELLAVLRDAGELTEDEFLSMQTELNSKIGDFEQSIEKLQSARALRRLADDIGDAFGNAFEDIIFGAQSAGDALRQLGAQVARLIFQQLVTQPIASSISGVVGNVLPGGTNADGAVFGQAGKLNKYAKGGAFLNGSEVNYLRNHNLASMHQTGSVFTEPLLFNSGDGLGVLGEGSKPEAILPLNRMPNGELGVQMQGGQQAAAPTMIDRSVRVTQNIQVRDSNSFRSSRRQLEADAMATGRRVGRTSVN